MLAFLGPAALAAPTFVAESTELVTLATHAWRHATACAGREALAEAAVPIEVGEVEGGFAGRAHVEGPWTRRWRYQDGTVAREEPVPGRGLYRIHLSGARWKASTVAHEVAHAWAYGGPPALVEGATTLLEACISERDPARFPPDRPRTDGLTTLVDLREWANPDDDTVAREAGYAAAERMFALLAEVVPRRELWRPEWTWEAFDAVLAGAGAPGAHLRAALAGGVWAQRVDLGDLDDDGILGLRERLAGTDPGKWDTDGDGWWDGAPDELRARGVLLPKSRRPVCAGVAAGPLGATIRVRGGAGRKEGRNTAYVLVDGARLGHGQERLTVPAGGSIALEAPLERPGWGMVEGLGLVDDARCWSDDAWMVIAAPGHEGAVAPFVAALQRADAGVTAMVGPPEGRYYVWLGEPFPSVSAARWTRVRDDWLLRGAAGEWDYVAAYAVAKERVPDLPLLDGAPGDTDLFEAVARKLVAKPPKALLAALERADVDVWALRALACPGGWPALLRGACGRPASEADGAWAMDGAPTAGQTPHPTEPP